jgi:aryl-alcohol dehydrogenase-like predicted oxidoreductase
MKQIQIDGTTLLVSRLSFGTASLHHLPRLAQRVALLQDAADAGFTHFDTAPYYGWGLAELSLGALPAAVRQRITVATKVGLYGPTHGRPSVPNLYASKLLGRLWPSLNRAVVDWSLARARRSLDDSQRRLQRERLDLLLSMRALATLAKDGKAWCTGDLV